MPDATSSDEVDPSEVQRIRDALEELRHLDAEVIAAWRTLRELNAESRSPDFSKVPPRRWFNDYKLEVRLRRFTDGIGTCLLCLMCGAAVVFAVWLALTKGPSAAGDIKPSSASNSSASVELTDPDGGQS